LLSSTSDGISMTIFIAVSGVVFGSKDVVAGSSTIIIELEREVKDGVDEQRDVNDEDGMIAEEEVEIRGFARRCSSFLSDGTTVAVPVVVGL